jgi:hypothetical protein
MGKGKNHTSTISDRTVKVFSAFDLLRDAFRESAPSGCWIRVPLDKMLVLIRQVPAEDGTRAQIRSDLGENLVQCSAECFVNSKKCEEPPHERHATRKPYGATRTHELQKRNVDEVQI